MNEKHIEVLATLVNKADIRLYDFSLNVKAGSFFFAVPAILRGAI